MLQVGVDCEEISRFRRLPYNRNERFYRRIFTQQEVEYCTSFCDPYPRFAARFVAKEAVIKALTSIATPSYTEIEIQKTKKGQPRIYIDADKFKCISQFTNSLSIAHSNSYAIAFVVVTDNKSLTRKAKQALKKATINVKRQIVQK
jgi:holo-[acyl-carrier protein] synthase